MYKKRLAMDQSNGYNDDSVESSADQVTEETPVENGTPSKKKRGRKPGDGNSAASTGKKKKKRSVILKISRKKIKKSNKEESGEGPGPDDDGEYEVEAIVDHKKDKGKTLYRIKWKGYPSSEDTWLTASDITCKGMLKKYKKRIERDTKDVYVVERILDHRRLKGTLYYRVRWANYGSKDDTWQPKESLNCNELLKEYHENLNNEILAREETKLLAKQEAKKSGEYEVEAIIDSKTYKGKTKYLIRWKGFQEADDTWENEDGLNCPELIRAFNKKGKKVSAKKPTKAKKRKRADDSGSEDDDSDDSDYGVNKKRSRGEYEVEKVLDAKINRQGKWEFFVMWKGYGPENNTWEPESNLNCIRLINQFLGKDKVPRTVQAKLEKIGEEVSAPKKSRKPPAERGTGTGGLRGRTKGELKVLGF